MAYQMHFGTVLAWTPELIRGTESTLVISAESIACGVTIGMAVAIARTEGPRWLGRIGAGYVEMFRNTPLLVQLFLIYFGLPYSGLRLSADTAAVVAISLNLGAYSTEIIRAGLLAIPRTQIEAGLALGMTRMEVVRYIVLVPAMRIIYPALTGQLTLTLLGSSMAAAISATELTAVGVRIESTSFRSLETYIVIAAIYIALTFAFRLLYWIIGRRLFRRKVPPPSLLADVPGAEMPR
jgi:polar amino acid transport system permease protein